MLTQPPHVALNAHLLSGEASYRSAGIHGYLYHTLAHLPDAAPEFALTVMVGSGQLPDRSEWMVCRSRIRTDSPLVRIGWEQLAAPLVLARLRPDLLHGMAFATPWLWRGPAVVTIFDLSFMHHPERLSPTRRLYLRLVTGFSARRARRVIAISRSGRSDISTLLGIPEDRIDVAYPGVGPDFCPLPADDVADFRAAHALPDRFILYLGTLEPRKNLDTLLRAYARLPQRRTVRLVLAGGRGWQSDIIFSLIEELGLEQNVLVPGFIPGDELPMWYNAATLFVYPSVYEGFGMPLIEAMACGVPVLASDAASLPEAVGPAGVLLPPADVQAWTDALADLLDDEAARLRLAGEGRRQAQQFTWLETARQTALSYQRALELG